MNETCRKDWKLSLSSKIIFKFLISSVEDMSDFACLFNADCCLNIDSLLEFRSMYLTVD